MSEKTVLSNKPSNLDGEQSNEILRVLGQLNNRLTSMAEYMAKQFGKLAPSSATLQNMPPFSENTDLIDEVLAKAQAEFEEVEKTNKAGSSGYSFKYANLVDIKNAVMPALTKYSISVTQPWEYHDETSIYLATVLRHKGQWIKSGSVIDIKDLYGQTIEKKKVEQAIGGRITYFRKYQMQSILFLYGEDTDDLQK